MRLIRSIKTLVLTLVLLPALAGCGGGGYGYVDAGVYIPIGTVFAENDTASIPDTVMYDFLLWPSVVAPGSDNLLPFPLLPGETVAVADVDEDFYDAESLMSDGLVDYLEVWFDVFVPGEDTTTFVAF